MRNLLIGCLLWTSSVSAQSFTPFDYVSLIFQGIYFSMSESVPEEITVTAKGVGETQAIAIETALNSAVQKAVGVLVISDQTVQNDRVIRNLVASYSSGVVNSYKIDTCQKDKVIHCTITAKVSPMKFMRKLQGDSQTIQVNGNDLLAKHQTAKNTLIQREKITNYYFSQIRQSGLDVIIREVKILPSDTEKVKLVVDYEVKWNAEYKKEILKFLERLEKDTKNDGGQQIYIQWGPTGLFNNRVHINVVNDRLRTSMLRMIHAPTFVKINELNLCEDINHDNVFTIDWYGVKRQRTIEVDPAKLRGIQSLSASIGCTS
jgi:hypothetical protein